MVRECLSLENKPLSQMSGVFQKRRGVRSGLPDVVVIFQQKSGRVLIRSDPRPSVRVTRGAGSGQHLASVLQERRENANIDAGLGFIWRISDGGTRNKDVPVEQWPTERVESEELSIIRGSMSFLIGSIAAIWVFFAMFQWLIRGRL